MKAVSFRLSMIVAKAEREAHARAVCPQLPFTAMVQAFNRVLSPGVVRCRAVKLSEFRRMVAWCKCGELTPPAGPCLRRPALTASPKGNISDDLGGRPCRRMAAAGIEAGVPFISSCDGEIGTCLGLPHEMGGWKSEKFTNRSVWMRVYSLVMCHEETVNLPSMTSQVLEELF